MEQQPHYRSEAVARLPQVPKDKGTTTPTQIIESGTFTNETLFTYIEELIIEGKSFRAIASKLNLKLSTLSTWLSTSVHIARTKTALRLSADYYADMSIQVLKDAPSDKVELMRAKELSSAYRWMARVRDVSKYGEKLDVTSDGQQIVQVSLGTGIKPPETTENTTYLDVTDESHMPNE